MSVANDIRRAAFNLLARREHSTTELFRKLSSKPFDKNDIHLVLSTLTQEGLLSDERFTESFVHHRCEMGYGPLRIEAELKERGISETLITQYLENNAEVWHTKVRQVWKKRFKNQLPKDFKSRAQQMRFLQYRGFTLEQIHHIFQHDDNSCL